MYTPLKRPRFAEEGYAVYPPDRREEYTDPFTGGTVKASPLGFIGIKPDAPQWAHDEYNEWLETHELANRGMVGA
jgi:hypothetical protein